MNILNLLDEDNFAASLYGYSLPIITFDPNPNLNSLAPGRFKFNFR